ncbi:MAG: hypothetical protein JWL64_2180 [Frankiales bacterium]|nr:hypothetical protein [Frankiales bacterium]
MSFLSTPEPDDRALAIFAEDVAEVGYVMNASRVWAHQPATTTGFFDLMDRATQELDLDQRRKGILVTAAASAVGDSYCSLVWGSRLAAVSDPETAVAALSGGEHGLTGQEQVLATWARQVARDPNGTRSEDVKALREVGFDDTEIFAITAFVALRVAFSTVNDALGMRPDAALRTTTPAAVLAVVGTGRIIDE